MFETRAKIWEPSEMPDRGHWEQRSDRKPHILPAAGRVPRCIQVAKKPFTLASEPSSIVPKPPSAGRSEVGDAIA